MRKKIKKVVRVENLQFTQAQYRQFVRAWDEVGAQVGPSNYRGAISLQPLVRPRKGLPRIKVSFLTPEFSTELHKFIMSKRFA